MDRYQSTLRTKARFLGVGLHSGRPVTLEVLPAAPGSGIVFQRTDLAGAAPIAANAANIKCSELSTTLGKDQNTVATVEHLMAAFAGLGVDNALVKLDGPEVPILDGSSAPFVDKLLAAGIVKIQGFRKLYMIKRPFEVRFGDRVMRAEPASRLSFNCKIDFASHAIGKQELDFTFSRSGFLELCESRTFCHEREVSWMRANGLALGGSLANAVVVTDKSVVNAEGLRSSDEFVRHKLLDAIGDLALLGAPLVGRISLEKAGHALHARFMQELLQRKSELMTVVEIGDFGEQRLEVAQVAAAAQAIYG